MSVSNDLEMESIGDVMIYKYVNIMDSKVETVLKTWISEGWGYFGKLWCWESKVINRKWKREWEYLYVVREYG